MEKIPSIIKVILSILGIILLFFGILFLWSAFSQSAISQGKSEERLITGIITIGVGIFLLVILLSFLKRTANQESKQIVQKIELPGKLSIDELKCKSCGATLKSDSVDVKGGTVFISCPYCGATYTLEEEPKW